MIARAAAILELPLGSALGEEFDSKDTRTWLADGRNG